MDAYLLALQSALLVSGERMAAPTFTAVGQTLTAMLKTVGACFDAGSAEYFG